MPNARQEASLTQIRRLLSRWDQGSTKVRRQILLDFIELHTTITEPELESEFAQSASLFFTRITSWLRISYLFGTCLNEQLRALRVFLQSSTGNKYLGEFLDVGGLFTLLEILNVNQIKDEDKQQALQLLKLIADNGRIYKELICQSYGIRAIAECMAKTTTNENTQKSAQFLLDSLAHGNPTYTQQVYKGLIAILLSTSPKAQELSAAILCKLQPQLEQVHRSLLEPVINLLQSFHAEVQYQAIELIQILMSNKWNDDNIVSALADQLMTCLNDPPNPDRTDDDDETNDLIDSLKGGPMPIYVQQAAACKCIRLLVDQHYRFLRLNVVHLLLCVMGNEAYPESQRQASLTLHTFVERYPIVYEKVFDALGEQLFDAFHQNPDGFYARMTPIQADVCRSNLIHMSFDENSSD
ncbi:unnamed protein product [Rotaria magnacalcarata]